MQPGKRQIIKTKPQRPYVIARIVLALIAIAVLALAAWWWFHPHYAHALAFAQAAVPSVMAAARCARQEARFPGRMRPIPATVERNRS